MTSNSFRDSISSLGWSRRENDEPVTTSQPSGLMASIKNLNPFQDRGYLRLPTTENAGAPLPAPTRREEEEGWFVLSRWDRLLIFGACNLAALACFVICFTLFPVLSLRPRKFVILWSVGSVLFLASFAAVMGPLNYMYHLLSAPRLPFTAAYFGSIFMTLLFAIKVSPAPVHARSRGVPSQTGILFLTPHAASKHHPHPLVRCGAARLPALVSGQLLPHGRVRTAVGRVVWN
ncbi:protein transport protein sft2, variant 2 [Purpureocillium takamizusanense]|uniref:Protein transport protein SFT2 n=1 Tax=Purpureocillium takamizusanense TaxID=2060973 RepID=A0A9Q8Q7W2_9HYPO|nr:protein transport protein sft2, variant 2 [Purpureocillium takamizusanense]UNI15203.1 protein transport protein sft2, variant 2 [Purpureocillium takamizusanense]